MKVSDIKESILENKDIKKFISSFNHEFEDFEHFLESELIENYSSVNISKED